MIVYKDKITGEIFNTNYFDHFNNVTMSPRGLVPMSDIEEIEIPRKEYEKLPILK